MNRDNKFLAAVEEGGVFEEPKEEAYGAQNVPATQQMQYIKKRLYTAVNLADRIYDEAPISQVDEGYLCTISNSILSAEYAIRKAFLGKEGESGMTKLSASIEEQGFCKISVPKDAIVRVCVPGLIGADRRKWYATAKGKGGLVLRNSIYRFVRDALQTYKLQHGDFSVPKEPAFLIFKRIAPLQKAGGALRLCDNNNMEMGEVANAISHALPKPDNYKSMSFIYVTQEDENTQEERVEATLIAASKLPLWLDYLTAQKSTTLWYEKSATMKLYS